MIIGIGIDICIIKRIEKTLDKYGERFKKRCFTSEEIVKCDKRYSSAACYAKRFAAKEAFSKAIGTGMRKGINWKSIEVYNQQSGKPFIKLIDSTKKTNEPVVLSYRGVGLKPLTESSDGGIDLKKIAPKARVY